MPPHRHAGGNILYTLQRQRHLRRGPAGRELEPRLQLLAQAEGGFEQDGPDIDLAPRSNGIDSCCQKLQTRTEKEMGEEKMKRGTKEESQGDGAYLGRVWL